jgi:hypothetical protein
VTALEWFAIAVLVAMVLGVGAALLFERIKK